MGAMMTARAMWATVALAAILCYGLGRLRLQAEEAPAPVQIQPGCAALQSTVWSLREELAVWRAVATGDTNAMRAEWAKVASEKQESAAARLTR